MYHATIQKNSLGGYFHHGKRSHGLNDCLKVKELRIKLGGSNFTVGALLVGFIIMASQQEASAGCCGYRCRRLIFNVLTKKMWFPSVNFSSHQMFGGNSEPRCTWIRKNPCVLIVQW